MYRAGNSFKKIHKWVVDESMNIMGSGDMKSTEDIYEAGIRFALENENYNDAALYLIEKSEVYNMLQRYDEAMTTLDRGHSWKVDDEIKLTYYNAKGSILLRTNRPLEGELLLHKALTLTKETGFIEFKHVTLTGLFKIANEKGDYVNAIEYGLEAIRSMRDIENRSGVNWYMNDIYSHITNLFANIGNFERAYYYALKQKQIAEKMGSHLALVASHTSLGRTHLLMNHLDSARIYIKRGLSSNNQTVFERNGALLYGGLSVIHSQLGNIDSARYYLSFTKEMEQDDPNNQKTLLYIEYAKGMLAIASKDYPQAEKHLNKAMKAAKATHRYVIYLRCMKAAVQLAKMKQDESMYNFYSERIQILEDSLFQIGNSHEIYNQESRFLEEQRRIEVEAMEAKDAKRKRQIQFFLIGSLILVLILGTVLILFRNNRRKSKMLAEKNQEILEVLGEKDVLLKEIHHRVKNNLSIVSSLLRMQSRNLDDPGAIAALKDSENRIQSMALIHRDLYQEEDLSGIQMPTYMDNLVANIANSFDTDLDVKIRTEVEPIQLDIDTVIPLGLIINELITNSFKYAFEGVEHPGLKIKLVESSNRLLLEVSDNGIGKTNHDLSNSTGFGNKMINALLQKLKGEMEIHDQNGYTSLVKIKKYQKIA